MSRIYFHSIDGEAEVRGPERHYAGGLCNRLALSVLDMVYSDRFHGGPPPILKLLPNSCYLKSGYRDGKFARDFESWFVASMGREGFIVDGTSIDPFIVALNTAAVMGSDPVKFLARLHGQSEIHAWVDGPNREWLAKIIEQGRETGILRADMGWENVVILLRKTDQSPVVTSYSVTDQFPNPYCADWPKVYEDDGQNYIYDESWYDLPYTEQFEKAMAGLRSEKRGHGLEMKPDNWQSFYFGSGVNAFHIVEAVFKLAEPD